MRAGRLEPFFFNDTATTEIYTLSLHDALPISQEETQLIISKQTGQWGTVYREENDLARIVMRVERLDQPVEKFTITIGDHDGTETIALEWGDRRYWVPVAVKGE